MIFQSLMGIGKSRCDNPKVPPEDVFTHEKTKSKTPISNDIKIWYKKNYKN